MHISILFSYSIKCFFHKYLSFILFFRVIVILLRLLICHRLVKYDVFGYLVDVFYLGGSDSNMQNRFDQSNISDYNR